MKKLSIVLTLVCGFNVFSLDVRSVSIVRNELWEQSDHKEVPSQLYIELEERWSEELEIAVKMMEEH